LRDVETRHARKLAYRATLSPEQSDALEQYWMDRIDAGLGATLDRLFEPPTMFRSPLARHLGSGFLFQVWFNTVGPGARTWFGNRYVGIRRYTFRLRWHS
jgi:hypothetical protein